MGQIDNLPTDSQLDLTETLDVGLPTSIAHNGVLISEINKSFKKQLTKSEIDKNKIHSTSNYSQHMKIYRLKERNSI